MKKVLLALLVSAISFATSFAQTTDTTQPAHRAFIYAGTNFAPHSNLSYSAEIGTWGMTSNTSFSATFDVVPVNGVLHDWIGAKTYYTVHSEAKLCYMVYVAPKYALDGSKDQLIEFGFNPNYTLNKNFLLGITLGDQAYAGSPWNLFVSAGIVFLIPKN